MLSDLSVYQNMADPIDQHVLQKFQIIRKLGKGVSFAKCCFNFGGPAAVAAASRCDKLFVSDLSFFAGLRRRLES